MCKIRWSVMVADSSHIGLHQKTIVLVSLGKLFHFRFVCSQRTAPRNIKLAQTLVYEGTNCTLFERSLVDSFLVPREIHVILAQCSIRTRHLSNVLPLDQPAPTCRFSLLSVLPHCHVCYRWHGLDTVVCRCMLIVFFFVSVYIYLPYGKNGI